MACLYIHVHTYMYIHPGPTVSTPKVQRDPSLSRTMTTTTFLMMTLMTLKTTRNMTLLTEKDNVYV